MNALSEVLHSFSLILYAVSFGFKTVMAAAALCRSRGVACSKGLLFVVTLMFLVCLPSSQTGKDQLVDTLLHAWYADTLCKYVATQKGKVLWTKLSKRSTPTWNKNDTLFESIMYTSWTEKMGSLREVLRRPSMLKWNNSHLVEEGDWDFTCPQCTTCVTAVLAAWAEKVGV